MLHPHRLSLIRCNGVPIEGIGREFGSDSQIAPWLTAKDLMEAFQYEVLSMLKKEGKITDAVIENMMSWHHSGFHVYIGERIQ